MDLREDLDEEKVERELKLLDHRLGGVEDDTVQETKLLADIETLDTILHRLHHTTSSKPKTVSTRRRQKVQAYLNQLLLTVGRLTVKAAFSRDLEELENYIKYVFVGVIFRLKCLT